MYQEIIEAIQANKTIEINTEYGWRPIDPALISVKDLATSEFRVQPDVPKSIIIQTLLAEYHSHVSALTLMADLMSDEAWNSNEDVQRMNENLAIIEQKIIDAAVEP